jgi:hypothetical protein
MSLADADAKADAVAFSVGCFSVAVTVAFAV